MKYSQLISDLIPCVLKAGEKILDIYNGVHYARFKKDGSPVTDADTAAEEIIISEIERLAPNTIIVSEENQSSHRIIPEEHFFLVDPLDGTKEFLKHDGRGSFTVNIGLIESGVPVMGIVYAPALERLFYGYRAGGAWEIFNGEPRRIFVKSGSKERLVAVASSSHRDNTTDVWLKKNKIYNTISIGSSLKFCLVASGEADVYPRFSPTMEWDTAAGDAILRAAGGKVTTPKLSNFVYGKKHFKNDAFIAWGGVEDFLCRDLCQ